jgi:hypothetical protein
VLFNFADEPSVLGWSAIDDRVMGGVSNSRLRHDAAGHVVFEGVVSLERQGGFASVRSRPQDLGVPDGSAYLLQVCSDGQRYKLNLRCDAAQDGVNYQAAFQSPPGVWTPIRLPLSAFTATWRGRSVPDAKPLDTARVCQLGLVIADGQAGPFALALRSVGVA